MSIMNKSIKELDEWASASGHEIRLLISPKRTMTGNAGFTGKIMEKPKYPFIRLEAEKCKDCKKENELNDKGLCYTCSLLKKGDLK